MLPACLAACAAYRVTRGLQIGLTCIDQMEQALQTHRVACVAFAFALRLRLHLRLQSHSAAFKIGWWLCCSLRAIDVEDIPVYYEFPTVPCYQAEHAHSFPVCCRSKHYSPQMLCLAASRVHNKLISTCQEKRVGRSNKERP